MSSRNRLPGWTGSVSLSGVLALSSGLGLILALRKFDRVSSDWSPAARFMLFAIAIVLLFTGLKQTMSGLWPTLGERPQRRTNRHRVLLPSEGLMYLLIMIVLFVGSLLGRSNMLMLIFAMMAGPFVLNGWITFTLLKRTEVRRSAPRRAMAGQVVSVEIRVENKKRWLSAWLMAARDRIANRNERLDATVLFARVPPGGSRVGYYRMRLSQRGRYLLGPVELSTRFPLGLVERSVVFDVGDEILIHPRIGQLTAKWKRDHFLATELVQKRATRRGTFDDEFHRIREYRRGDDPRAIHWRTSARRNELMVREFHQSRDEDLAVFLDLWAPKSPVDSDLQLVERAVSFAGTVCFEHLKQSRDASLFLLVSGAEVAQWEGGSGAAGVDSMLDLLAIAEAGASSGLGQAVDEARSQLPPNTHSLLITTRPAGRDELLRTFEWRTNGFGGDGGPALQIVEAGEQELAPYFVIDPLRSRTSSEASTHVS